MVLCISSLKEFGTIEILRRCKKGYVMTKNVEVTVDIKIARMMLVVAGFTFVDNMTDDEVFEQALKMNEEYGVTSVIKK